MARVSSWDQIVRAEPLRAERRWGAAAVISTASGLIVALWGMNGAMRELRPGSVTVTTAYLFVIGYVVWQFVIAGLERPVRANRWQRQVLGKLDVAALVPVYNEDPLALKLCLQSLFDQTRSVQAICVIDDGSTTSDYPEVRDWFFAQARDAGIRAHWQRTPNGGKRHAQAAGLRFEPDVDLYLTVDSDSILDPHATAECLKGFADHRVQSVAAIMLTTNYNANLLTRVQELYFVAQQMFERSALSQMGAVMVNCGGCAFYRHDVIWDNIDTYLSETVFGKPMIMSDDSLLTLFALERGRAIQQPNAFAFTLMPESFSHHRRQQLRWMRGSFIRSGWRFRHLPLGRAAYWLHLARWLQFVIVTVVLVALAFTGVLFSWHTVIGMLVAISGLYMLVCARYLSIRRSDQSAFQRFAVFATAPLVAVWATTVMRVLRWYAMATFRKIAWGTRSEVEVAA